VHECTRAPLTCRRARKGPALALALALRGRTQRKSGGEMFLRRSSAYRVMLMPQVGCHCWCFPDCWCCAWCAAVRQGPRSQPGLLPARAVLAFAVNGARLPRRPGVSWLFLPGSAVRAGGAALPTPSYGHSPQPVPTGMGSGQSGDITSPERLAGVTSPPFRCSQIRLGWQQYAPGGDWAISRCNQILTKLARLPATPTRKTGGCHRATGCDSLVTWRVIKTPAQRPTSVGR
jgi:hypothetical protein